MSISKADNKFEKLILILSLIIFALTFIIYKYRLVPDSGSYIDMHPMREPLYPFFLFIFRFIFNLFNAGDDAYFYAVSVAQNLLAAYALYFAVINLRRLFNLNNLIAGLIFLVFLAPSFFTIILSRTGVVMSCSIGTEALTVPLYYIYFTLLIKFVLEHDIKYYIKAILISVLLALTRGQMLMLFIINFFAFIAVNKKFFKALLIMLACFALTALITRSYFYIVHGQFIGNRYGAVAALPAVLLSVNESDADLFEDKDLKELYIKIMREIDLNGYKAHYKLSNSELFKRSGTAEFVYDAIRIHAGAVIYEYATANKGVSGLNAEIERDKIASSITKTIMKSHGFIKNFINIYFSWVIIGCINSVAMLHPILDIYAALIYVIALSLLLICVIKKLKREALFMIFALLALIGFVTSVALVVTPISRYVIYGFTFFYSALLVCLGALLKINNKML